MKKNLILITILVIALISTIILKNLDSKDKGSIDFTEKKAEDLNPISKSSVLKVLKAEFGENVVNTEDDVKDNGDYYLVEVKVNLGSQEEHTHTDEELSIEELELDKDGNHIINIGIHKINKYTGELSEE